MRRVILESPYAAKTLAEIDQNVRYARACVRDCLLRGDAPIVSHLLFTQPGILRDGNQAERALGMKAGFAWRAVCEAVVIYTDRGISPGMKSAITHATQMNIPIEYRRVTVGEGVFDLEMAAENAKHDDDSNLSPALLSSLLLTVGVTIEPRVLPSVCLTEADMVGAARWARAAHARAQGEDVEIPTAPAWLEPFLSPAEPISSETT